jgi:hypothetical protein
MTEDDKPQAEYTREDLDKLGSKWLERIAAADKREEKWFESAEAAERAFLAGCDDSEGEVPEFNIVHSNVETIVPSIYNSAGKPDIRPRHNNREPVAKVVSDILERAIMTMVDDSRMDAEVEQCAQDIFVAGRGIVRLKFDADVTQQPAMDPMTGQPVVDEAGQPAMQEVVTNERVEFEVVSWRDFRMGPASRWKEVPWVAFRHCIAQEVMEKIEDPELAEIQADPDTKASENKDDVHIWEIWCKETGNVYFIVDETGKVLSIKPDPLKLSDFFPCATPVQPITATGKMTPVCPYEVYKTLAEELDMITRRIRGLTDVLKAKGAIAGDTGDLEALADADDGEIVPFADMENIMSQGGLEKAIMWWPIDRIIQVIRELNVQREQTKNAIYEITGISDIIRGQGAASETATAQQIKTQWGSLRIKKMQRMIERLVRELFVKTAEIISLHVSPPTLQKLAGMEIPQEAMPLLQKPLDHYRIDVESNSTIQADLERGRQEMSAFLQGTGQYFAAMAPIVGQSPQAGEPVAEIYGAFAKQFSLGKTAEDALDKLVEMAKELASNPPPNPEAQKAEAEMQAKQAEMQMAAQEKQAEFGLKQQEMQQSGQVSQMELQLKAEEIALKREELELRRQEIAVEGMRIQGENAAKQGEMAGQAAELATVIAGPLQMALAPLMQMVMASSEKQAADTQQMMQAIAAMAAAMSAPKEIVRDETGRAMGVRSAMVN